MTKGMLRVANKLTMPLKTSPRDAWSNLWLSANEIQPEFIASSLCVEHQGFLPIPDCKEPIVRGAILCTVTTPSPSPCHSFYIALFGGAKALHSGNIHWMPTIWTKWTKKALSLWSSYSGRRKQTINKKQNICLYSITNAGKFFGERSLKV